MAQPVNRRQLLRRAMGGLAAAGAGALVLRAGAQATPESGELGAYGDYLKARGEGVDAAPGAVASAPAGQGEGNWSATEDNILGPFYREGAPFRGKVTPPLEPGNVLLITGRVWSLLSRKPIDGAVIDLWQANEQGRYDNDDPAKPPAGGVFVNRCRIITDDSGAYEYETIHPGAYRIGPQTWRPPHVHYLVRARGHRTLVTQLYFEGDPHQVTDAFIKPSLVIALQTQQRGRSTWRSGRFDVVLGGV